MTVNNTMKKGPTLRYGMICGGFWMDYLVITSFAAVFLSGRGFSTKEIGVVTALGSLIACVLQQITGTIADKSSHPLKYTVACFVAVCMASGLGLILLPSSYVATFVFYVTALTLQISLSPLINSLCLQFTNNNYSIDFGLARSMGSLGYALCALVMGDITNRFGAEIILPIYLGIYAVLLAILLMFPVPTKDSNAHVVAGSSILHEKPSTLPQFLKRYHRFVTLIIGVFFIWFLNNILCTYMIYFIRPMGGTAADMGIVFGITALSEIPIVFFSKNIMGRLGAENMLRISAIGGLMKPILYLLAPNIKAFILLSFAHLIFSGFYQMPIVYYSYAIVGEKDIIKGQSILGIAGSIGSMVANYVGGSLLEVMTPNSILWIGVAVNTVALVFFFLATDRHLFKNEPVRGI